MTEEALEEWSIDYNHKKAHDRIEEGRVMMSIDCKSNEAIPRNVEALEARSNDYGHNQVKVTKEAREVMIYNCMKRKVKSGTKEAREEI